jgi:hypothetical protein
MREGAARDDGTHAVRGGATGRGPGKRAAEWNALRLALGPALRSLESGQWLILQTRGEGDYYVQFAAGGSDGLRAEAVSNKSLDGWKCLDTIAERRLRRLGWRPPTDIGDGPVNCWRYFDDPVPVDEVAKLAVSTLKGAYDVPRPSQLVYRAFTRDGEQIVLPGLGVDRMPRPGQQPPLADRVDAALRSWLGADTISYDEEGDAPIRCGDAMIFVQTLSNPEMVAVFSPMLADVEKTSGLLDAVNEMNVDIRYARAFFVGSSVMIDAEVDPATDLDASLARACDAVGWIADHWGAKLQARFGGTTFFGQPSPAEQPGVSRGPYL